MVTFDSHSSYICLGYFIKYLDQTNISAYTSALDYWVTAYNCQAMLSLAG